MYTCYKTGSLNEDLTIKGIPFRVRRDNGVIVKLANNIDFKQEAQMLFFLGMATESWQCSEWWGQQEVHYDHTTRLFFGDRVGKIRILFDDRTEELVSVIFGVNCFNYNLYFKPKEEEGNLMSFAAPYDEPFRSDKEAKKILDASLRLMENDEESAQKASKWIFAYKLRPNKTIVSIAFIREPSKSADFMVSAVTALNKGEKIREEWDYVDLDFFLRKDYFKAVDKLRRRVYQFKDEIPNKVELLDIEDFDGPDIRFYGSGTADIYTNIYRKNIMDMAYHKVTDDGMPHTSSENTANYGCYVGFGTYTISGSYASHVWTRDIGRSLIEITNLGYFDRALMAVDKLHEMLYYPSIRFKIPHWKRVANLIARDENDLFNEGKENDGHASIMLFIYNLYNKGAVDKNWLKSREKELRDAADYYIWQYENPKESNFFNILFSESETSTQTYGGYDLYANVISLLALEAYAKLFIVLEDEAYAKQLLDLAMVLREGVDKYFLMDHPRYGKVYTDTTDDCWTYEYKRFCQLLIHSDIEAYDSFVDNPRLFEVMDRTFMAQKELYYEPFSGRQMGYGQGYLNIATLSLDLVDEYTDCMEASAMLCYHHSDNNYIVPEGVIVHGSKDFWFRNSDLGNSVQQAEIIKCARLMVGIDDLKKEEGLKLVPRLPKTWTKLVAKDYLIDSKKFSFAYGREEADFDFEGIDYTATDGNLSYRARIKEGFDVKYLRMGPFDKKDISSNCKQSEVKKIGSKYYVYLYLN